jgi:deoxyribodipyrimidine photolyase-related protein
MVSKQKVRNLVVVLGDQLDPRSAALDDFDDKQDTIWMAEVPAEAEHVWSHKARIALFLSAMRHFRDDLKKRGYRVHYRQLDEGENLGNLAAELQASIAELQPEKIVLVEPGEWRVKQALVATVKDTDVDLEILDDSHFLCSHEEFAAHAKGRKQLRLEYFYREMRQKHEILLDEDEKPVGGKWNYDSENRGSFKKSGPGEIPVLKNFPPDAVTQEVLELVEKQFPGHPGELENFDWPVNTRQAQEALKDFVENRLQDFGTYQDAMWTDQPYLYHSRLSAAMNLKLLDPREVIAAAVTAYDEGSAPLNAVEGFVRQILGWREYVRGIYWLHMPEYLEKNTLAASHPLPDFYWTGKTEMNCLRDTIKQTLQYGYAHHIQRLMVTGLFALLWGVDPKQVHEWYLAVYVDAVEWVELPNTLGMSQFADDGVMASKPYAATGKYINRMSNYCKDCRFNPDNATGRDACPFTTLYWDFLMRHEKELAKNQRMALQVNNLKRKSKEELKSIRDTAKKLREDSDVA